MKRKISIVIPCYDEEQNIEDLKHALDKLYIAVCASYGLEIVAVDDGSKDDTFKKLLDFKNKVPYHLKIVKLSGNFGSYNALMAGLQYANGDCFIQLHADLQESPEYIPELLDHWEKGNKLVIGQRVKREENFVYLLGANLYHFLIKKSASFSIPKFGYDLILFDKQLKELIINNKEDNVSVPYLISSLKFPYALVPIKRTNRKNGQSNYTLSKRISLIINSLVSFSKVPIKMISVLAAINIVAWFLISILAMLNIVEIKLIDWGFYSLLTFIFFSLSIIGEYLLKTLEVSRNRATFVVDQVVD